MAGRYIQIFFIFLLSFALEQITFAQCTILFDAGPNGRSVVEVTNTNDSGEGSLRSAIDCFNDLGIPGGAIFFNIPGGVNESIQLLSPLPTIILENGIIDGSTQTGELGGISLDCSLMTVSGETAVMHILASKVQVLGLQFTGLDVGVQNINEYTTYLQIGTKIDPSLDSIIIGLPNKGNNFQQLNGRPEFTPALSMLRVHNVGNVSIQGNSFGTNVTRDQVIQQNPNLTGIFIETNNEARLTIGGTGPGEENLIGGMLIGTYITAQQSFVFFEGNYIGTNNVSGQMDFGNQAIGIYVDVVRTCIVGGIPSGSGNTLAHNSVGVAGVRGEIQCTRNTIINNNTGIDISNRSPQPAVTGNRYVLLENNIINNDFGVRTHQEKGNYLIQENNFESNGEAINRAYTDGTFSNGHQLVQNEFNCNQAAIVTVGSVFPPTPTFELLDENTLIGSSIPNGLIDVYEYVECGNSSCQGSIYLGSTNANGSGEWTFLHGEQLVDKKITVLLTDENLNTSNFSDCVSALTCRRQDSTELVRFYNLTSGAIWTNSWNLSQPMTTWFGVQLSEEGCVTSLDLDGLVDHNISIGVGNNISGILPNLILDSLEQLILGNNNFSGSLIDFDGIGELRLLDISNNDLSGPIPDFSALVDLEVVNLGTNGLIGSLPDFTNLPKLNSLDVSANSLDKVQGFTNSNLLTFLNLSSNNISDFPLATMLPNLVDLDLSNNEFVGAIPNLDLSSNLKIFKLSNNKFNLPVPDYSVINTNLGLLDIRNNDFTFEDIRPAFTNVVSLVDGNDVLPGPNDIYNYNIQNLVFIDTFVQLKTGDVLDLDLIFDENEGANNWRWSKDGSFWNTFIGNNHLQINSVTEDDSGVYTVEITNNNVPGLTLTSRTITLNVTTPECAGILPTMFDELICPHENVEIASKVYMQAGSFFDTLQTAEGCDSILIINITHKLIKEGSSSVSICQGESISFNGLIINDGGTYMDTLMSSLGCDSIFTLEVIVNNPSSSQLQQMICAGASYDFNGKQLSQPGIYFDTITNIRNCDSIIELALSVNLALVENVAQEICEGAAITFFGKILSQEGIYRDSSLGASGCDSVVILDLSFAENIVQERLLQLCNGESLEYNGATIITNGSYRDTLTTADGCDSIEILSVEFLEEITFEDQVNICAGMSYLFKDKKLTSTGEYMEFFIASAGCDSLVKLTLNVLENSQNSINRIICPGEIIIINDKEYSSDVVDMQDTLSGGAFNGCDSIITVNITVENKLVVARDDNYVFAVAENTIDILANDEIDLNELSLEILAPNPSISTTITPSNRIEVKLRSDFNGAQSFTYELCDVGCFICDTALVTISYEKEKESIVDSILRAPTGFTPNGDGTNDKFIIPVLELDPINYGNNEMVIFDRWGNIVHQSKPYQNNWDGTDSSGSNLPSGTYYYILRLRIGGPLFKKGEVTILR